MSDHTPAAEHENVERAKENRENTVRRIAESGVGVDKVQGDHTYGWTAQQGPAPAAPDAIPGQVFTARQLPDPVVQQAWGVDPAAHAAGLEVVSDKVALGHPGGPEADEAQRLGLVGTAYSDSTPDARVNDWMGGRDEESKTDLAEAVEEENAKTDKEKSDARDKADTKGLSPAQANAVRENAPVGDTGPAKKKTSTGADTRGKSPAPTGSASDGVQGVK